MTDREVEDLVERLEAVRANVRAVRRDLNEVRRLVENLVKERGNG
jgi:hypothetical protein